MSPTGVQKRALPDLVPFVVTWTGIVAALYYGQGILRPLYISSAT